MAGKIIHHDVLLDFGKYKGSSVEAVFAKDPAYFHWCRMSGIKTLDAELTKAVDQWVRLNPKDARRTEASAMKMAERTREGEKGKENKQKVRIADSETPPWESEPSRPVEFAASSSNESWGSW